MTQVAYEKYEYNKNAPRLTFIIELHKEQYLSDVTYVFLGIEKPKKMF